MKFKEFINIELPQRVKTNMEKMYMYKKRNIDFVLYEDENEILTFRFYPRQSSCHSFDDKLPTKWEEVYKVYYSYSVFIKDKEDCEVRPLFECNYDECSVIGEVAARIALVVDGKKGVTLDNGRFIELLNNEVRPMGDGVSWEIKECRTPNEYEVVMWDFDNTGYRFTLEKNELKAFGEYLNECCEYMLAHGDPI